MVLLFFFFFFSRRRRHTRWPRDWSSDVCSSDLFEVEHWYDVLLDGPKRAEQIENLKGLLRTMGRLGIEVMGYNFSYANVFGKVRAPLARGGAMTPAYIPE